MELFGVRGKEGNGNCRQGWGEKAWWMKQRQNVLSLLWLIETLPPCYFIWTEWRQRIWKALNEGQNVFACLIQIFPFEDAPEENPLFTPPTAAQHPRQCSENPNFWALSPILLQLCCVTPSEWRLWASCDCVLQKRCSEMRKAAWNLPLKVTFSVWERGRQYFDMFNNPH